MVTGSREEKHLTAAVAGDHALDLGGATDWPQLAGVLRSARAVVIGNTGAMHLAAAVSTPLVCLFSPVVPAGRWRPYGVPHVLLGDQGRRARAAARGTAPSGGTPAWTPWTTPRSWPPSTA